MGEACRTQVRSDKLSHFSIKLTQGDVIWTSVHRLKIKLILLLRKVGCYTIYLFSCVKDSAQHWILVYISS
jgi:hypothetical protein